jgi:hypothetical protein
MILSSTRRVIRVRLLCSLTGSSKVLLMFDVMEKKSYP